MTPVLAVRGLERTAESFRAELVRSAARLGLDAGLLAAVMSRESGFNPKARNAHTLATGLIQFMPATARILGTTIEALFQMTADDQLAFVEKYYRPFSGRLRSPGDYYMATFMPAFVGKPPETVLFRKPEKGYEQNAGLDLDKDGTITVGDVTRAIEGTVSDARGRPPLLVDENIPKAVGAASSGPSSSSPLPAGSSGGRSASAPARGGSVHKLPTLRAGDSGPAVELWQKLLNLSIAIEVVEDGRFGPFTELATIDFQKKRNLTPDGVVGADTWEKF